jgi:hypothetical protein
MRRRITTVALAAASAAALAHAAEAKFPVALTVDPAQPVARRNATVTLRTGVVLPRRQPMRLIAVGPWRPAAGQAVLDVRLVRRGPRSFTAALRFPHTGRWTLDVITEPGAAPLPPVGRTVTVRHARIGPRP